MKRTSYRRARRGLAVALFAWFWILLGLYALAESLLS